MSSFSRSFKSPSYLSQYRSRPTMGGRTFSNSSERSYNSDDGPEGPTHSGRTTPQAYQTRRYHPPPTTAPAASNQSGASFGAAVGAADLTGPTSARESTSSQLSSSSSHSSSPIAIELPRASKKIGTAPVYTPPEPLSARGDLPGGYFPNHEDPKSRIQRTHPFHSDKKGIRTSTTSNPIHDAVGTVGSYRDQRSLPRHHTTSSAMGTANVPVASYFPSGYHDSPLPMGKYYPTNYERTHGQSRATAGTPSSPADARSPGSSGPTVGGVQQDQARQAQLQQYKREMMAQATRAANEVMGASQSKGSPQMGGLGLKGFPGMDMRFGGQVMHKPNAPRLHPLGSPGPVTPMELESSGTTSASGSAAGGSYLDKGSGGSRRPSQAGLAPPDTSLLGRSL